MEDFDDMILQSIHEAKAKLTKMKENYKKMKENLFEGKNEEIILKAKKKYTACLIDAVKEEKLVKIMKRNYLFFF